MKSEEEPPHGLPSRTVGEEIANTLTHGAGLLASLAAMGLMLWKAIAHGDFWHILSCATFGATLVILYLASTLYHGVRDPDLKKLCRVLDHSAIYLLIAGTYTPFTLVTLRGDWGWLLFAGVWGIGLLGILLKLRKSQRKKDASLVLYLVMGWMVVFAIQPLLASLPVAAVGWLAAGGLTYMAGILFYLWDGKKFAHTVWHVFVMGGSFCHVWAVLFYVLP
jgi:hemolysin III